MLVTETPDSPPVAHEDLLVEDGAVGAEEGDRVEGVRGDGVPQTHVVRLPGQHGELSRSLTLSATEGLQLLLPQLRIECIKTINAHLARQ